MLVVSIFTIMPANTTANVATFEDINDPSVFVNQQIDYACTHTAVNMNGNGKFNEENGIMLSQYIACGDVVLG